MRFEGVERITPRLECRETGLSSNSYAMIQLALKALNRMSAICANALLTRVTLVSSAMPGIHADTPPSGTCASSR